MSLRVMDTENGPVLLDTDAYEVRFADDSKFVGAIRVHGRVLSEPGAMRGFTVAIQEVAGLLAALEARAKNVPSLAAMVRGPKGLGRITSIDRVDNRVCLNGLEWFPWSECSYEAA